MLELRHEEALKEPQKKKAEIRKFEELLCGREVRFRPW